MQPVTPLNPAGVGDVVDRAPCPLRARAWWDGRLVAESTATVRVERPGVAPELHFPPADVRLDLLPDGDGGGAGDVLRREGGAVVFDHDHDRVRVDLVDAADGDEPRDVTVKRFPTWGDAAHIVDLLDVRPDGERRYVGVARTDWRRPVVEGSQMLGQAIVASGRHAPGRRAVVAHMVFVRPADAGRPLLFELEELSAGTTFVTLAVHVSQDGRRRAEGTLLLDALAPDVIRHAVAPPDVAGPYESEPHDMSVTGRDVRIVGGAYTGDPDAPAGPPVLDAWVRFRNVPADPYLHAGLLAHFTGHLPIAAALRPHEGVGQHEAHRTLSTAINAITLSLHADVRADRWMAYRQLSTFAGDGMTHAECRVHDDSGGLLASFTVDAMVRPFRGGAAADERTAL